MKSNYNFLNSHLTGKLGAACLFLFPFIFSRNETLCVTLNVHFNKLIISQSDQCEKQGGMIIMANPMALSNAETTEAINTLNHLLTFMDT